MIHLYQNNGYNIVLDVNSGAVHVVDQAAYDVIGALEKQNEFHTPESLKRPETAEYLKSELGDQYNEEDIRDILEAVVELTEEGRLFTRDVYEDFIDEVKQRKTVVKALCLHIAHDCNLACRKHSAYTLPTTVTLHVNIVSLRKANTTEDGRSCPTKWERKLWTS